MLTAGDSSGYMRTDSSGTEITNVGTTASGSKLPLPIMPPEIWESTEHLSFATDVWSFGVLLWEMFTGGRDVTKYMMQLHNQSSRALDFPCELIMLCKRPDTWVGLRSIRKDQLGNAFLPSPASPAAPPNFKQLPENSKMRSMIISFAPKSEMFQ